MWLSDAVISFPSPCLALMQGRGIRYDVGRAPLPATPAQPPVLSRLLVPSKFQRPHFITSPFKPTPILSFSFHLFSSLQTSYNTYRSAYFTLLISGPDFSLNQHRLKRVLRHTRNHNRRRPSTVTTARWEHPTFQVDIKGTVTSYPSYSPLFLAISPSTRRQFITSYS